MAYAPARFVSDKLLKEKANGVYYRSLPRSLYRVVGKLIACLLNNMTHIDPPQELNPVEPLFDLSTLRRDLYQVMCLLQADEKITKEDPENEMKWTQIYYETEVQRLTVWLAVSFRGFLDLLPDPQKKELEALSCGEFYPDHSSPNSFKSLSFRQACNSTIHAKEILTYIPQVKKGDTITKVVYKNRITIRSHKIGKMKEARLDIVKFVKISNTLINAMEK